MFVLPLCCWQVLALVFIRKLLDFIFTKRELSWLDDLMPESKKKKMEDAEKEVSLRRRKSTLAFDVSITLVKFLI